MRRILSPNSQIVIHYSDKAKPIAQLTNGFSDNHPEKMRSLVADLGYEIREEVTKTMWHSSIVRFGLPPQ